MLRININSITYENGKYYYREEPYTGVAFILNNCKVEKAMVIKSGDIYGEYINEYLSGMSGALKIDSDCLVPEEEGEDEPLCYNGKGFQELDMILMRIFVLVS